MTADEIWEQRAEAVRKFIAGLTREELLKMRLEIDWMLGYREFQQKVKEEGIVL